MQCTVWRTVMRKTAVTNTGHSPWKRPSAALDLLLDPAARDQATARNRGVSTSRLHSDPRARQRTMLHNGPTMAASEEPAQAKLGDNGSCIMPTPITVEGAAQLREELAHLKNVVRPSISKAIGAAREHGDLRENAEYHAAKERQGITEARVRQIEQTLADAQVIDVTRIKPNGKVVFGATVALRDLESDARVQYKIVGADEADIKANKISVFSPLARALIGRPEGDAVVVNTPQGRREYEIDEVTHR